MFVCFSARSYIRSFFSSLVAIPYTINDIRLMANNFFHTLKVLRGRYSHGTSDKVSEIVQKLSE